MIAARLLLDNRQLRCFCADVPAQVVELVDAVKIQTGGAVALESGQCMTGFIVDGYNDAGRDGKDLRLGKAVCFQHPGGWIPPPGRSPRRFAAASSRFLLLFPAIRRCSSAIILYYHKLTIFFCIFSKATVKPPTLSIITHSSPLSYCFFCTNLLLLQNSSLFFCCFALDSQKFGKAAFLF